MIILLLFACLPKQQTNFHKPLLGVVDIKNESKCLLNLPDESHIFVEGQLCNLLKEGDIIYIKQSKIIKN